VARNGSALALPSGKVAAAGASPRRVRCCGANCWRLAVAASDRACGCDVVAPSVASMDIPTHACMVITNIAVPCPAAAVCAGAERAVAYARVAAPPLGSARATRANAAQPHWPGVGPARA
jgi:hypothetical protein